MDTAELLAGGDCYVETRSLDKVHLLVDMTARAAARLGLRGGIVSSAVFGRERLGSTILGGGIAIPHAAIRGVDRPVAWLARLAYPIAFDGQGSPPVDLVLLLLAPKTEPKLQVEALACIARTLRSAAMVADIRAAASTNMLRAGLVGVSQTVAKTPTPH